MGKAHRGRRVGEGETTIQREALSDILSPSDQAGPTCQDRRDIEGAGGSSLFDQTPAHEDFRRSPQGAGNQTWVGSIGQYVFKSDFQVSDCGEPSCLRTPQE